MLCYVRGLVVTILFFFILRSLDRFNQVVTYFFSFHLKLIRIKHLDSMCMYLICWIKKKMFNFEYEHVQCKQISSITLFTLIFSTFWWKVSRINIHVHVLLPLFTEIYVFIFRCRFHESMTNLWLQTLL